MTGAAPIVISVASGTEVSDTAAKQQLWKIAASSPITVIRAQAARPDGQVLRVAVR